MTHIYSEAENNAWAAALPGKMTSACLAICTGDEVLMVKARYKDHWTFPSGIVDQDESPMHAALRETHEETGLIFNESVCEILAIAYTSSDGASRDRFNIGFRANVHDRDRIKLSVPNEEIVSAEWVSFANIASYAGDKASYQIFQSRLLGTHEKIYNELSSK